MNKLLMALAAVVLITVPASAQRLPIPTLSLVAWS